MYPQLIPELKYKQGAPPRSKFELRDSIGTLILECMDCGGNSELGDSRCRACILGELGNYPEARRLILNHYLAKEYQDSELELLQRLALIPRGLARIRASIPTKDLTEDCSWCRQRRISKLEELISVASSDPYLGLIQLLKYLAELNRWIIYLECRECFQEFLSNLESLASNLEPDELLKLAPKYIRPSFCGFKLITQLPPNSVLLGEFQIGSKLRAQVQHYGYQDSPEQFYRIVPPEFQLSISEIKLLEHARRRLLESAPQRLGDLSSLREYVRSRSLELIQEQASRAKLDLSMSRLEQLAEILVRHTLGLGVLEYLLEEDAIQDIYINAPAHLNPIQILVQDQELSTNLLISEQELESLISKFRALTGRPFSEAAPVLDLALGEYRARISVIGAPLSPHGIAYSIRKHRAIPFTLPMLVSRGMLDSRAAGLLSLLVDAQSSILITGDVGSGKTSLLGSLLFELPQSSRIIAIEDTPELPIPEFQRLGWNMQSLITSPVTSKISAEFSPEMALKAALRLGNAVLVVGEVRGPEVKALVEAMQIGAAGNCVLGTIHGASTMAVYERMVNTLGIPPKSFNVIDLVVVCSRARIKGTLRRARRVIQLSEVNKRWESPDQIFNDLMVLDRAQDRLNWVGSESALIEMASSKLGISKQEFQQRWELKSKINSQLLELSKQYPWILEPEWVTRSNNLLRSALERALQAGEFDLDSIFQQWKSLLVSRMRSS